MELPWRLLMVPLTALSVLALAPHVEDTCTRCACQYLTSSHLTDTVCTIDQPVLQVNCSSKPKVRGLTPSQPVSAGNTSAAVWLSFEHGRITSFPSFATYSPFNVTMLALDHNRLVYLPPHALASLPNLTVFTASHNDLRSVAPDAFHGLRFLRHVDLSHNSIHSLDLNVIPGKSLVSLDVHGNGMKTVLPPATKLHLLETLDLSSNNLPDFPLLFFSSFPNLLKLNVSHNELGVFTADLFQDLEKLKVLDGSWNELKTLDHRTVSGLRGLEKLLLTGNQLSEVSWVESLPALRSLDLSHNNLTSLGDRRLGDLNRLVVSHNRLDDLTHVFPVFEKLKSLDAGFNPSVVAFPEQVRGAGLRSLVLDGTSVSSWPARRPADGTLQLLSLSHIPAITALGPFAFSGILKPKNETGKCVVLKISNTSLSSIDEDALTGIDICQLDLSGNRLRWVPSSLVAWDSLVGADLQANPWHCDCALQWMLTSVVPLAYNNDQALLDDLRCATPADLAGVRLVHWYNHPSADLCGAGAPLTAKRRPSDTHPLLVTLASSPMMIAVLLCLSIVAVLLVVLGFALQRRAVRVRKLKRNRRF